MMPRTTMVLLLLLAPTASMAGPVERVLLVGDSWADFMWGNRTLRDVFADNGRPDIVEAGAATAISGSTAAEWAQPAMLQMITDELDARPSIDVVQLTVGGNDFLAGQSGGGWYVGIPQQDLDALYARLLADAATILDHILAQDPAIEVLISLYDYVNLVDGSALFGCTSLWNELGQPTPRQVNDAFVELQAEIASLAGSRARTTLVDHRGLMQFTYGFPDEGIPPGALTPPGDLDRPSPIESMFLQLDCIHLRSDGYYVIGQNLWQGFYGAYFDGGPIFGDGFEAGDASAWSQTTP